VSLLFSFDDLVRPHEYLRRNRNADLFSCPEINHELKPRRLLKGNVARLGAFQYLIDIHGAAAELIEAARMDKASEWQIYWRIVLPLAKASLARAAAFS